MLSYATGAAGCSFILNGVAPLIKHCQKQAYFPKFHTILLVLNYSSRAAQWPADQIVVEVGSFQVWVWDFLKHYLD